MPRESRRWITEALAATLAGGWLVVAATSWCHSAETPAQAAPKSPGPEISPPQTPQRQASPPGELGEMPSAAKAALSSPAGASSADGAKAPGVPTGQPLSKEMQALRDRVRRILAGYFRQPPNTADNTPGEILAFCLAFGCDAEVRFGSSAGQPLSAVGCLCWNYACAGYELLTSDGDRPIARIGYGLQSYPSQFLGVLAQAGVPASYEVRVGKFRGTVADLVAAEQRDCRPGADLSHKLMGMAFYVPAGQTWKDRSGDTWSVARLVREELDRDVPVHAPEAVHRLIGLSFAVNRQRRHKTPLEGPFAQAETYLSQFHDFALGLQNPDGSWHPRLFAARGSSTDAWGTLRATALVGQWLALSLPESRLSEPAMVKAIEHIAGGLERLATGWNVAATKPRDIETVGYALYTLRIYDSRVFQSAQTNSSNPEHPQGKHEGAE